MTVYGWRWWDIRKDGSLRSVNDVLWEPDEEVHATCLRSDDLDPEPHHSHKKVLITPDGRRTIVPRETLLGKRRNGAEVIWEGAPAFECMCGFWGYYDPEGAFALPRSYNHSYLSQTKVFGVIEGWGDVVHMELGFRCEFAAVRAVVVTRGRLHAAYNIPRYSSLEEIEKEWDVQPLEDFNEFAGNE